MLIRSTPSFDSFVASQPSAQAAHGNGDNASFARLMQQRQQEQDSPKPSPRAPVAATPATAYDHAPRPTVARSEAKAPATRQAEGDSEAKSTQAAGDTRQATSRKAEGSKLDRRARADAPKTDEASTTDPVASQDKDAGATPPASTSTADLFAQFPGLAPKQAPIAEAAEPGGETAEGEAGTAVAGGTANPFTARTPLGAAEPGSIALPTKDLPVPGPQPVHPRDAVGSRAPQDQSPISLAPVADSSARADKPGIVPGGNDLPALLQQQQQAAMLAESPAKAEKTSSTEPIGNLDAVGATAAAGAVGPSTQHVGETPTLQIPTPVHSPEFKEALGVQVSILAKDGIQHAELHLNPTDMGPISVQIATEGTHARVDFGADSAATRQILEAGLPELASALQSAGLTLTGGGVSQHSQGGSQGQEGSQGGSRNSRRTTVGVEAPAALGATPQARSTRGGLDLYA